MRILARWIGCVAMALLGASGAPRAQDMADAREFAGRFYDYCVRDISDLARIAARAEKDRWAKLFTATLPDTVRYQSLLGPLKDAEFTHWAVLGSKPTYSVMIGAAGGVKGCVVQVDVDPALAMTDTARLLSAKRESELLEIPGDPKGSLTRWSLSREGRAYVLHAIDHGGRFLDLAIMTKAP